MNNQLSSIAVQYRKFSKGQYIGPDQFNEFLDYFEDQDRLSRMLLQGVGIVCGFKPTLIYKDRLLNSIQLSQGVAVTTDGDLLTLNKTQKVSEELYMSDLKTVDIKNKEFTHFKAYDNFKVKYPSFYEGAEQIELWELATAEEAKTDFQPITKLSGLEDKYLLLYLEDYEKEMKPCVGVDCDNHGVLQVRNLKVLVTTAKGITHILGDDRLIIDPITGTKKRSRKDRIQPHPLFIDGILGTDEPQRVIMSRLIAANGVDTRFSSSHIKNMYIDVLAKNKYGQAVFEKIQAIAGILGVPTVSYQPFRESLARVINQEIGYQYAYDVLKDLMDTYSEIIKLLPKAFTKCLPDFASFPKHMMLGKLISDTQLDSFRHQFYNSPVLDDDKATQKVKFLISRFNHQVGYFDADRIMNNRERVKITQSRKLNPLSNKAIPFYYNVTEEFLKVWNFEKTGNRSHQGNLAYDTDWQSSNPGAQDDPLVFNIDRNSFYNIEGHQGMDYQKALEQIKQIRDKQQLGFDIVALSLEELVHNKDFSKAYFNEYLEQNPGMEHWHGVEKGGTFLIVYDSIRNPNVIADFSLPYICCTPKSKIHLSLPMTAVCVKSGLIPFTVSPVNGIVKAVVDSNLDGGVREIDGVYYFDPGSVSPQLLGQEITFTVNGKSTDCSIKVTSQPDIKVEIVEPIIYPGGDSVATIVNLKVSGPNFANYTYTWDFLGNDIWVPLDPDKAGYLSYKYYKLDPKNMPAIRVKVSNSGCTETVDVNLPVTKECPVISNIKYSVVDNGNDTQTFTFDWVLPSDLSEVTGLNIFTSDQPGNGWNYESGSYRPRRSITLPLGKYYIRFGLVGSCRETGSTLNLPGFDDIGIIKSHPPTASIRWKDNSGIEDRLCRQSVCNYTIEVSAADEDNDIANIQIFKSTDNSNTWNLFTDLIGTTFGDSINKAGKQSYRAVVTDKKGNKGTSNTLSYEKGNHPPAVSIKWNDTFGIEDRVCSQSACSYAVDVYASDPDGDIATIQVYKSTDNRVTWSVFPTNPQTNTFTDSVNQGVTNWYKAVVTDAENNIVTSNILSYKNVYRPAVVIDKISFPPTGNCCNTVLRTLSADAGRNQDFTLSKGDLPDRQLGIKGSASGATHYLFFWSKLSGPDVILENVNESSLIIKDIREGKYTFQFLVKDAESDAFAIARVDINVAP